LAALAKQYFQYGQGRRRIVNNYKQSLSFRYLTPPITVLGLLVGIIFALIGWIWQIEILQLGAIAPLVYLVAVLLFSGLGSKGLTLKSTLYLPAVFICMHICWGVGFLKRL
jgi:high-affinity Fe2+/Pb2+ permease